MQVRVLFSKGPFISVFASDPHIIIKAINQNLNSVLRDSNINGHDYMRNIVHLPVFLNSRGLSSAKICAAAPANGDAANSEGNHGNRQQPKCLKGPAASCLKILLKLLFVTRENSSCLLRFPPEDVVVILPEQCVLR